METQSAFMAAAATVVLVAAVLIRRRDRAGLLLAALTAAFGLWALGRGIVLTGRPLGGNLERASLGLLGPLALAFVSTLGARVPWPGQTLVTGLVLGAGITVLELVPGAPRVGPLPLAWSAGLVALATFCLIRRRIPTPLEYSPELTRLRYVTFSHVGVAVAACADAGLGSLALPRGVTYFAALLYLYVAYLHLARVRLGDLQQLLGNTLALALLATGLASFFAALYLWVGAHLELFVLNAFLGSFVLLLFYDPIRRRVQAAMDRWLVGGKVALERSLAPLRARLSQVLTLDELLREILRTLERTERVTGSAIFLRDDPRMGFQLAASIGLSPRARVNLFRDPSFVQALQNEDVLLLDDLERPEVGDRLARSPQERAQLLQSLRGLDAQVLIALRAGSNLVGFWTLTDANSSEPFSTEEVRLLRSLAAQAAVSIENSKTFERIRARDRLVALGEMAGGLAHEIRNPLATIRTALALLETPGDEDPQELREMVVEEVHRLNRTVGLFLDYARPSPSHLAPWDVVKTLERAVEGAKPEGSGCARVDLQVEPELPRMPLDGEKLERVISNLVRNALEACGPAGSVRVLAETDRADDGTLRGLQVLVEDDGCGMDAETLERAFVPFFTTRERGVGLGLALCERLVRAEGGQIDIRSEAGSGTRARVWLPLPESRVEETRDG